MMQAVVDREMLRGIGEKILRMAAFGEDSSLQFAFSVSVRLAQVHSDSVVQGWAGRHYRAFATLRISESGEPWVLSDI